MAILRIIHRHIDRAMYDAVNAHVDIEHEHPLGLIMHGASSEVGGTMQIVQIWDSEEYMRRFDEKSLIPALRAAGAPVDADITMFELEYLVTP